MAEDLREYVVRRAGEVRDYKRVCKESGIGMEAYWWLRKLAAAPKDMNLGYNRLKRLATYYKLLEAKDLRRP
jgi:hypothetical protein